MRYLVNFSNQVAAGPRMIAKNFILESFNSDDKYVFIIPNITFFDDLPYRKGFDYIRVPSYAGSWKSLLLVFYVNIFLVRKLCNKYMVDRLLAFGNFSFGFKDLPTIVLLHHPYIVDDVLYGNLKMFPKFVEFLKRQIFSKTVRSCKTVIVQTEYMLNLYLNKYGKLNSNVVVIPNPIANNFKEADTSQRQLNKECITLFYPSRFYPHKNHEQALNLAIRAMQRNLPLTVLVTINPLIPGASDFLIRGNNVNNLVNLGELSQEALIPFYNESTYMFFPSLSETYGNPLAEAMIVNLPVIAPDMGYSRSIVKNAGWYFNVAESADYISDSILDYIFSSSEKDYQRLIDNTSVSNQYLFFPFDWQNKIRNLYDTI